MPRNFHHSEANVPNVYERISQQASFGQQRALHTLLAVPPLPEQRRIVTHVEALLTRVQAARERLAKAPARLKRFRQSVLAAACSGQLTADWRETNLDGGVKAGETLLRVAEHKVPVAQRIPVETQPP